MSIFGSRRPSFPSMSAQGETFAAVDLGSNSFHLIVARVEHGELHVIDRLREMVRFAAGLDTKREIDPAARQRALECLARFGQRLKGLPASHVRAVGTNTFRKAKDPRPFLRDAEAALGHDIEIISGYEEARLVYLGVAYGLASDVERRLVIDIGGGSTELVIGQANTAQELESLAVGCVGLSQRFFADGKITRARMKKAETAVALEIRPIRVAFQRVGWDEVVGSSGTIRTAAKVMQDAGWAAGTVTAAGLKKLRKALEAAGQCQNLGSLGVPEERAPVFPGGVAILEACLRNLDIVEMRVSDSALREGALYDLLGRTEHYDPRATAVTALAQRYRVDQAQARRVEDTALIAFDQLQTEWSLDGGMRSLLQWAARLHEVGLAVSHDHHHYHGAYLVEHSAMTGFSQEEQQVLAALIGGHRRKPALKATFGALPERLVRDVKRACAILRLAVMFHRSRVAHGAPDCVWSAAGDTLTLTLPPDWLREHPLTEADLQQERRQLKRLGLALRW